MKKFSLLAIIVIVITISSCKKEAIDSLIKDGPSPMLAQKGTPVSDTISCVEEVKQFVELFKAFRAKQGKPIPIYYDRHLVDLIADEDGVTSSVQNKINKEYYVALDGEKKHGRFTPFSLKITIDSPQRSF